MNEGQQVLLTIYVITSLVLGSLLYYEIEEKRWKMTTVGDLLLVIYTFPSLVFSFVILRIYNFVDKYIFSKPLRRNKDD